MQCGEAERRPYEILKAVFPLELSESRIDIWTLRTEVPRHVGTKFERVLVAEELDRAFRFRFDRLYASFVLRRGALRYLLGRYLNCYVIARSNVIFGSEKERKNIQPAAVSASIEPTRGKFPSKIRSFWK